MTKSNMCLYSGDQGEPSQQDYLYPFQSEQNQLTEWDKSQ